MSRSATPPGDKRRGRASRRSASKTADGATVVASSPRDETRPADALAADRRAGLSDAWVGGSWLGGPWAAVLLGVACYLNTLGNGFVYDDVSIVVQNPRVRDLGDWRAIWLTPWWYISDPNLVSPFLDRLYRPLTLFTLAMNHALGGLNPFGYHLANVLLHGVACGLTWLFVWRLTRQRTAAMVAGWLFAVHPVHTEAVAGIVGRAEILATIMLLVGCVALLPRHAAWPSAARLTLAAVCCFLALLAKETAICYPALAAILLIYALRRAAVESNETGDAGRAPVGAHRLLAGGVILLLPLLVYFPLRWSVLGGRLMRDVMPPIELNPLTIATNSERVWGAFTVLGHYVRLLISPAALCFDYGVAVVDPAAAPEPLTWLGIVAAAALCAGAAWHGRARTRPMHVATTLALLFLASYVLISNTVLLIGVTLAERLMYWPSVIFCALVGLMVATVEGAWLRPGRPLAARAPLVRGLGLALLAALLLRTLFRNADWHSNRTLFETDATAWPRCVVANLGLANELMTERAAEKDARRQRELVERAERHLRQALEVYPVSPRSLLLLGQLRVEAGDVAEGRRLIERAAQLAPHSPLPRQALAALDSPTAPMERIATLEAELAALGVEVGAAGPRSTLPGVSADTARAASQGTSATGSPDLQAGEAVAPRLVELARLLLGVGRRLDARARFEQLVQLKPDVAAYWNDLGEVRVLLMDERGAREAYERAVRIEPENWQAHANLSLLLATSDSAATLRHAEQALRLQPADIRVRLNYAEALLLNGRAGDARRELQTLADSLSPNDPLLALIHERLRFLR